MSLRLRLDLLRSRESEARGKAAHVAPVRIAKGVLYHVGAHRASLLTIVVLATQTLEMLE